MAESKSTNAGTDSPSGATDGGPTRATERAPEQRASGSRAGAGRPAAPVGRISEQPAGEVNGTAHDTTQDTAQGATEAVGQVLRQGQDAAARSVALGAELLTRLSPFTLLSTPAGNNGGDAARSGPVHGEVAAFPLAAWADGMFALVETALAAQRRFTDQVLSAQRQLLAQVLDTGASIATATATQVEAARPGVPDDPDDSRSARH